MSEKEIKTMSRKMQQLKKELSKSKKKSKEFLEKAGIIDKNGNLKPEYK